MRPCAYSVLTIWLIVQCVNLDSLSEQKLRCTARYDKNLRADEIVILIYANNNIAALTFISILYLHEIVRVNLI